MSKKKLFAKRAALVSASAALALVAVELTLRALRPSYTANISASYEYDAELAFRLRPGEHLLKLADTLQESRTNALGASNFQEGFDDYETLVFAAGDSYTQGLGVPADASYPFQLDLLLNRDAEGFYAKRYGVVNLGVAGYGPEQSLIALRRFAALLRPPTAVLYVGCDNDFVDDLMFKSGRRHGQFFVGNPRWGRAAPALRWLADETQIGLKLKRFFGRREREGLRAAALASRPAGARRASEAELGRAALDALADHARSQGTLLVVSWSDEGESYDWMKSWAAERGVAFADWSPRAKSVRAAIPALPLDNAHSLGHHRVWLNRVMAEEFARHLLAGGK